MDKKALLTKLETLFNMPEVKNGFPSREVCVDWANRVAPLLKFNKQYYVNFAQNAHKMNLPLSSHTLVPAFRVMTSQIQMAIEELRMDIEENEEGPIDSLEQVPYVDKSRLLELRSIVSAQFDMTRLIRILEELNVCHKNHCYISVITLTRALLDHVSPIFACKAFSEVANNYSGSKSFKESMMHLEKSSRKIADQYLHTQVRPSESLPNQTQVNFSNDIDVLLGEIVRVLE